MKLSKAASIMLGSENLKQALQGEVPRGFREVVARGWFVDEEGAVLLRQRRESYFGDRARFADIAGYEAAVNGRGIPDLDIEPSIVGQERGKLILLRGLAMAWFALCGLGQALPGVKVFGYLSASPTLMDPEDWTGNLTFVSVRDGSKQSYIDVENVPGVLILIDSEEHAREFPPSEVPAG